MSFAISYKNCPFFALNMASFLSWQHCLQFLRPQSHIGTQIIAIPENTAALLTDE